jgi:hypothetical protein
MLVLFTLLGAFFVDRAAHGAPEWQASPTAATMVRAEALNPNANVRANPTIEGEIRGQIQPGEQHVVRGWYFEWLLIEYPTSPDGYAWVHQSVVAVTGDVSTLPQVEPDNVPFIFSTPTLTATPASIETTTAPAETPQNISPLPTHTPASLPTFTPPPATPTAINLAALTGPTASAVDAELERRLAALRAVYVEQPLLLRYADALILLNPAEIGFALDEAGMADSLAAQIAAGEAFDVSRMPIIANHDEKLLREFVQDVAARYDDPNPLMEFDERALTFSPSTTGRQLDLQAAEAMVTAALFNPAPAARRLDLPLRPVQSQPDMAALHAAIREYLESRGIPYRGPNSVLSIYVQDLESGEEMGFQADVRHSATSTSKIGVLATYFRYQFAEPSADMRFRLASTIICSSNSNANLLMEVAGNSLPQEGIRRTSDTFCQAGATDTYVSRHYWIGPAGEGGVPADYYDSAGSAVCEGNTTDSSTPDANADPLLYTTASDMGHFLAEIYACAQNGSGLAETFPGEIIQTECQWMLEILSGSRFYHMGELGVPEDVTFAHKVGYGGEAAGDAGIVYSPGGDYVFVIYIWDDRLDNFDSYALGKWVLMGEMGRVVYNYFNMGAPLERPRQAVSPLGGAGCVMPSDPAQVSLTDIDQGRFDESGNPLPEACYDWPTCRPFAGWGQ